MNITKKAALRLLTIELSIFVRNSTYDISTLEIRNLDDLKQFLTIFTQNGQKDENA